MGRGSLLPVHHLGTIDGCWQLREKLFFKGVVSNRLSIPESMILHPRAYRHQKANPIVYEKKDTKLVRIEVGVDLGGIKGMG